MHRQLAHIRGRAPHIERLQDIFGVLGVPHLLHPHIGYVQDRSDQVVVEADQHESADKQANNDDDLESLDPEVVVDGRNRVFDLQADVKAALPRAELGVVGALHDSHEVPSVLAEVELLTLLRVARHPDGVGRLVVAAADIVGVHEGEDGQIIVLVDHQVVPHIPIEVQVEHDCLARCNLVGDDVAVDMVGGRDSAHITGAPTSLADLLFR